MTVQLGLGVLTGEWHPGQRHAAASHGDELARSIDLARAAETHGLDSVWVSEHHFHESRYAGSLAAYCGALVQATTRIGIGYGLAIAPLHHPVRLAEDAAFLDALSGGRFTLGLGLGYRDVEFQGMGVARGRRAVLTEQAIAVCRAAWSGQSVGTDGGHMLVSPRPDTAGGPPIMLGGHHPRAVDRAARLADRYCMDAGTDSQTFEAGSGVNRGLVERVKLAVDGYRAALRRHGHPDADPPFSLNVGGFLHAEGRDAAWQAVAEGYMQTRRVYADWYGLAEPDGPEWHPETMTPEQVRSRQGELLLGTVDEVLPTLAEVRDIVGGQLHVMFRSVYPWVGHDDTARSIEQLGELRRALLEEEA
ncbi:LLM class flavin-dependent oxidoreductase [Demequina sp. NBRC 110054]|uniref:LLM class flavin-dependent oxidoreductase n=1 Tax=Demequina sp. NBRC 110054 TaxID=1570343 RepID=UPI000A010323|nr:LLM class flavin-dependent oxidoreductase [Demequina sp. NBRC 110054]